MENFKDRSLKLISLTNGNICDHCLGRFFYQKVSGKDNEERGRYIKTQLASEAELPEKTGACYLCGDLFETLETIVEKVISEIDDSKIEFSTFLMGCRVPPKIIEKEKKLQEEIGFESESIKKEINRELGKQLEARLEKLVDFNNPNLVLMMDFTRDKVDLQINPLFLEGRYRKLIRGIPQTKWPCMKCKGSGCERCNFTGKMYPETVEELVAEKVLEATKGKESKFHGAGREDVDVRMLGSGRPFVLEIKEPKIRNLNLKELNDEINNHCQGKVEVLNLKMVNKDRRSGVKASTTETYKIYRALVEVEHEVDEEDLKILESLEIIKQRTPLRVSHRRTDKIRTREVKNIQTKKIDSNHFELIINCSGGLYIKELISGDEERTQPSVTSLLGFPAKCVELDVLEVNI
ncbi:MAG: tRNA pseudouridine(54/55) synthase Pus10 [Methanobacteriaceae archaeon]|nr:tRNA pseudouridine(54/55) synthase Pus10 [Methanobacteriaceae archaeon]